MEIERIQQKYPHLRKYQDESSIALSNYLGVDKQTCDKSTLENKSTELTPDKHQLRQYKPTQ